MKIYVIRHAQTDSNKNGIAGDIEEDINETGVQQCLEAREKVKNLDIDLIISSILVSQSLSYSTLGIVAIADKPWTRAHIAIILFCMTGSGISTLEKVCIAACFSIFSGRGSFSPIQSNDKFIRMFFLEKRKSKYTGL